MKYRSLALLGMTLLSASLGAQDSLAADDTDYISIDTSQEARLPTWGSDPRRVWDLPYLVVDRPSGGSQAQWNLDAVEAGYATLDEVKAAFPTLADLQANTPAA